MKWSNGIILAFVFFVVFILSLVYRTMNTEVDLVSEDYYAQEIAFQEIIDGKKNYKDLNNQLLINQTVDSIFVEFSGAEISPLKGSILFFRPSDKTMDKTIAWSGEKVKLSKNDFFTGQYVVKARWKSSEQTYYHEEPIYIQR